MTELHLIIPGLTALPAPLLRGQPRVRALLARSRLYAAPHGVAETVCAAAGLHGDAARHWPPAPVAALGDGLTPDGWLCVVEPVPLTVYTDHVRLADPGSLALDADEAAALVASLNGLWGGDGVQVTVAAPQRWYLHGAGAEALGTGHSAAGELTGRRLDALLEAHPDRRLVSLLTEAQMLFHAHAVNRAREAQGRPAVGGVWLSGGGRLAAERPEPAGPVYGEHPYARGLATLAGQPDAVPVTGFDALSRAVGPAVTVLSLSAHADAGDALAVLQRDWLDGAWRALASGRLRRLWWWDARGRRGCVGRRERWLLWRRDPAHALVREGEDE